MIPLVESPNIELRGRSGRFLPIDFVQLALFSIFAFSYSLYMAGILSATIYYLCLAAFSAFASLRVFALFLRTTPGRPLVFGRSAAALLAASTVLLLTSIIQEVTADEGFSYTSFSAVGFIIIPTIIALCICNTVTERIADLYMTIYLARYLLYFLVSGEFSIDAILSISWSDSTSPFESSFAHDVLIIGMYFVVRQKKIRTGLSTVFTMLALKRAAFIAAPLFIVFGRQIRESPPPKRKSLILLFSLGVVSPFLVMATYSVEFTQFFRRTFGRDFNDFTSGRLEIYQLATHCADTSHAFGSLNRCLSDLALRLNGTTWNSLLHNDTLRVYMEVGLVGLIAYIGALVYASRASRPTFILMIYTFFVLATSRLITHMSFWIVLFTVIALFEMYYSKQRSELDGPDNAGQEHMRNPSTHRGTK